MRSLVLGGTAWLGRAIARDAHERGHEVTCLARGESGEVADGVTLIRADRRDADAYDAVSGTDWDVVVEVSWQPGMVRSALAALAERAASWQYVSTCSVYAQQNRPDADERAELLAPSASDTADRAQYGEAKVACERLCAEAVGDRLLIARSGLIGGHGDVSGRFGYWPARFAASVNGEGGWTAGGPVLVPDEPTMATQVIDVRDLVEWLVRCAEAGVAGTFNANGELLSFADVLLACQGVTGAVVPLVPVTSSWLLEQKVGEFAGPRSLPLWIADPDSSGFSRRNTDAAVEAGLTWRPMTELAESALRWEQDRGLGRERRAGLSPEEERQLLAAWRVAAGPENGSPASRAGPVTFTHHR